MKHLLIRFALFVIIATVIIVTSVLTYSKTRQLYVYTDNSWDDVVPYSLLDKAGDNNIILDSHTHTLHSDGRLTVRQAVLWHIAMGYNAMFITDHNTLSHSEDILAIKEEFKDDIIIMLGMEWTTARIHMNFLGLTEWDFVEFPINRHPTDQEIEKAIAEAHRQGAVVVANHYVWSRGRTKPSREQLLSWGVDYFEIINDDCYINDYYDRESITFCEANGLGQITGTDMHYPNFLQVDGGVRGWTLLQTSEFSEEAIMEQLRLRNITIYHSTAGAPSLGDYTTRPSYKYFKPLIEMGGYFKSMYIGDGKLNIFAIGIVISYLIILFAAIEGLRLCYNRFIIK